MAKKRVGVSLRKPSAPERAAQSVQSPPEPSPVGNLEAVALQADLASEPPEPQGVANVDAFVHGAAVALQQAASEVPAEKLQQMLRRGPEGYRELTIYLPEALADALSVHCRENGLELSQLVASAVEYHLKAAKTALDAALSRNDSVLSVAARSLIGDLRGWVRAVLGTRLRGFRTASAAT